MAGNDFRFDVVAGLKQSESEKQVKKDIKSFLSNIKIPLIGTLSSKTKAQLKQDIASLNGKVNLTGKVDSKGVTTSLQHATAQAQKQANAKPVEVCVDFNVKKDKLVNDIKLLAQQNSKLFKNPDMTVKYNSLLDNAELAKNTVELSALRTQLGSFRSELKITGNAGLTMTDALRSGLTKVLRLFGSTGIIMQFTAQLRKAWTEAKELDKSMTDLSRVNAEITRSGFTDYLDRVIDKTKQLAVATKDYIDAVTTFSRAGYNLTDSETLADMAVQLEKVGDMSAVDASKALLAGLQGYSEIDGYGMDQLTEKAQALNDKIDLIGNTASITQAELSQGIQAVGSVMNDTNTSVDEFLALLGAGNRAVQDSNRVALAIRTSALRIRGCTAELQEMGEETDNVIESTSTLAEKIKALTNVNGSGGVNILEADEETFRSIYAIYNDIAKVYDKMSDKDASALLDLIAGKNRSNQISAILQNMSEANELLEKSLNATGTASAEYEIYINSAQAATERFGVAMTETYSNIISGDTVKGFANAGAAVLDFANSWNILEGTLRGFLALGVLKGITTLTVAFKNSTLQISNYGSALEAVKNLNTYAQDAVKYANAMDLLKTSCVNLTDAQLKQVLANRNLSESQLIEILQLDTLEKEQVQARLAQLGLIQTTETQTVAQGAATASTFSFSAAIKGLGASIKAAWMTNPIGIIIMGVSTAIGVATSAISKYNQQLEETRRANIDAATTASENADKLKDLYSEYTRLASIQDRTTSEEEAFKTAVENITVALGNKEKVLENLTAGTDEYAEALARATKEELQSQAVTATIGRKSAEEDLQGEIWSAWKGSKVSIDSNSKGKSLSDEAQKAVAIVSDSLKEFETINRTWKNISWDISSDDSTEALEFYNSLVEAREKLVLASEDDEALLDTEIYVDINNAINTMSESLDTYIEKLYEEKKLSYMAQNGIPSVTEEYKAMESALVSAAGSSVDLQERFKELLMADFSGLATNIDDVGDAVGNVIVQTKSIPATISSSIKQIATQLEPQFSKLSEAYQEIFKLDDNGKEKFSLDGIDNSMLEELRQTFAEIKEEVGVTFDASKLESFFDTLTNGESTSRQVKDAFNELATAYLYSTDTLEQLNSETADSIEKQLEAMGVQNASEIVADELKAKTEELIVAKEYLAQTGKDLASATEEERTAFILEQIEAGNCGEALALLQLKKMLVNGILLDTSSDINNVLALAQAAGIATDALTKLQSLKAAFDNAQASGNYGAMNAISGEMSKVKAQIETDIANFKPVEIQFDATSAAKSASKAGKSAGDAYKKAFQDELQKWKDLEEQGKISHKQYLDALLRLVKKYFGDRQKYAEEYAQYMNEYLKGYLDLYNSALSGINTLLNRKISAVNESRDATISALQEEKEAAAEAYQSQIDAIEKEKDAIDDLIKEKNKKIDAINKEIDAIERATETRKKNNNLQQQEYNLEHLLNQRTILQYSKERGLHYVVDQNAINSARQKVKEAQEELKIDRLKNEADLIQKEIDLLEEKKDALSEEQEVIQKLMDESNKYYDNLIKQQEKMFDSMIKNMEQQKSKWEELAEIQEIAEAYSAIEQVFGELGYSVEDILNGSESAFEDFKSRYIAIMSDMNQNTSFQEGLEYASGVAKENFGSIVSDAHEAAQELSNTFSDGTFSQAITQGVSDGIVSAKQELDKMDQLGKDAGDGLINGWTEKVSSFIEATKQAAIDAVEAFAEGQDSHSPSEAYKSKASDAIDGLLLGIEENKQSFIDAVKALAEDGVLAFEEGFNFENSTLNSSFDGLKLLIESVTEALGIGTGGSVGGLLGALDQLSKFTFSEDSIVKQFNNLKTAIDDVVSAISGGGTSGNSASGSTGSKGSGTGGGTSGLVGAIESFKSATDEALGGGSGDKEGEGSEGGGTGAIPQFQELKTSVEDVTTAIGSEDSKGESSGESGDLISSIDDLGTTTDDTLGKSGGDGVIGRFEEFKDVIGEANEHVTGIAKGLDDINGREVECTIKVHIETDGSTGFIGASHVLGSMKLDSAEYNAKYAGSAHAEGTALVSGNWAVQSDEKNALVGEVGRELIVRGGRFFTVGDNGAEMFNIKKGDIVFNHEQTESLLKHGYISGRGKAYADGTVGGGKFLGTDGHIYRPLQEGDPGWDLMQAGQALIDKWKKSGEEFISNAYFEHQKQFEKWTKEITNNTAINNVVNNNKNVQQPVYNTFNITMPNVTNSTSAESLMNDLQSISTKKFQMDW